MKLAKMIGDM